MTASSLAKTQMTEREQERGKPPRRPCRLAQCREANRIEGVVCFSLAHLDPDVAEWVMGIARSTKHIGEQD